MNIIIKIWKTSTITKKGKDKYSIIFINTLIHLCINFVPSKSVYLKLSYKKLYFKGILT